MRGPLPKSAELRQLEGERAHRPLPPPAPRYATGTPERPKGMTAAARRVWDAYMEQMAPLGIVRLVDVFALQRLCEDVALLQELQAGMRKMAAERKREAKRMSDRLRAVEQEIAACLSAEPPRDPGRLQIERIELAGQQTDTPAMLTLAMSHDGRRLTATINSLASRIGQQERQFGLTPISGQRLEGTGSILPLGSPVPQDSIESRLCG